MGENTESKRTRIFVTKISEAIEYGNIEYLKGILHKDLYQPSIVLAWFKSMISKAKAAQRGRKKFLHEIKHVLMTKQGVKVLVITPWGAPWSPDTPEPFVYEFRKEEGTWRIASIEGICFPFFDLKVGETVIPPSLPLDQVRWMNTEFGWSVASRESFYQYVEKEKGEKAAKEHLESQAKGITVAVRSLVPFVEGPAQLATYDATVRCNIHGSKAKVEVISEDETKLTFTDCREAKVAVVVVMGFPRKVTRSEYCKHCTILFTAVSGELGLEAERMLIEGKEGNLGCATSIRCLNSA